MVRENVVFICLRMSTQVAYLFCFSLWFYESLISFLFRVVESLQPTLLSLNDGLSESDAFPIDLNI